MLNTALSILGLLSEPRGKLGKLVGFRGTLNSAREPVSWSAFLLDQMGWGQSTFPTEQDRSWRQHGRIFCFLWKCHRTHLYCPPASTGLFAEVHQDFLGEWGRRDYQQTLRGIRHPLQGP